MKHLSILSTKNYKQFRTLGGNRRVNRSHVNKLISSIEKADYTQYQPILVTKDLYVIDGQHRLEAAKALEKEVYYTILPDSDIGTVQMLNANMKAWGMRDFCESHASRGNDDYKELVEFADENDISMTLAADLLGGSVRNKGKNTGKLVRSGTFKVLSRENADESMRRLKELQPFTNGAFWKSQTFLSALIALYQKGMDHDLLRKQFQFSGKRLYQQNTVRDYVIELLDVYNRGLKKQRINLI